MEYSKMENTTNETTVVKLSPKERDETIDNIAYLFKHDPGLIYQAIFRALDMGKPSNVTVQ